MTSIGAKVVQAVSGVARRVGASLDSMGSRMEVTKYTERLVPSTRFVSVDGVAPELSSAFVAPSASVIGDVTIGKNSSIWYGATVRGDVNYVSIGEQSSIGDRAVVHVAKIQGDAPTKIGNQVTIAQGALVHAATLQDSCVIGESAQVLDGATVETNAMVAPGSVVTPGTTIPKGELWGGSPAKKIRSLTPEEIAHIGEMAKDTMALAQIHAAETSKDYKELAEQDEIMGPYGGDDPILMPDMTPNPSDYQGQGMKGYIYKSTLSHPEEGIDKLTEMADKRGPGKKYTGKTFLDEEEKK